MERWRRIEPEVREELVKSDIELIPRNLPEILAKIHTGETADGKGIFLIGTTGTGKTRRIEWASENFEIPMADAITLSLQLAEVRRDSDRMEVLNLVPPRFSEMPRHVCDLIIDDLGTEEETYNVYGTQRHLMTEAIIANNSKKERVSVLRKRKPSNACVKLAPKVSKPLSVAV